MLPDAPLPEPLPWINAAPNAPYFVDDTGRPWTPIGQNDAITWPELAGLFRRRDLAAVDDYLVLLQQHGVTCLRLMLEYAQSDYRHLERPVGKFQPNMVRLWDDLLAMCARRGLRVLLTPFDTFWMWQHWTRHPYSRQRGGPCADRSQMLLCRDTREVIKARWRFVTERWGGSGVVFAWDLWNEIHPAYAGDSTAVFQEFIAEIGSYVREVEQAVHGRSHLQTVSVFGPILSDEPQAATAIYRHPLLDFANLHIYASDTIDAPRNTVEPAVVMGQIVAEALGEIRDGRPFFDSEHGPIHAFKDHRVTLPEAFDDEYFRHLQWAHFAAGGAGGGMRWPNRHPHQLTSGMRLAQRNLADFLPLIDWLTFQRQNWNDKVSVSGDAAIPFACGSGDQALIWLLRRDQIGSDGRVRPDTPPISLTLRLPPMQPGRYRVTPWDTRHGALPELPEFEQSDSEPAVLQLPPFVTDMALAVRLTHSRASGPGLHISRRAVNSRSSSMTNRRSSTCSE
jgi:hypothetical protein